ncbi:MAG: PD40 domain-containing protein [Lewinellaceae bacterium]|nr:PD40 domain-containing protein [Lewinellaceae bacterium]
MTKRYLLTAVCSFVLACWGLAQGTQLLRQPTISDKFIVFVYADDLWIVDHEGGEARRLTSHEGTESFPHFSPDGKMIAFSGEYDGNTDVFVIPVEGGEPKRLTWHPGEDIAQGWTPDGKEVLFRSGRMGVPTRINHFYTIGLQGGYPKSLPIPQASFGELSPDGKYAAYTPITFWDPEWRNYRGGQAQPIWIVDLKTMALTQTPQTDRERHTDPVWFKNEVFFLSERDYANNVWRFDPRTKALKQVTFHKDFDVKSIDAGPNQLVYEQGGYLHTLDPQTGKSKQLEIHVRGDFNWARPRWEDVRPNQLTSASLSPSGQRALFEYRGDIFTAPKENGDWRNLTQTGGVADRSPIWSPDGQQIAWFSDASGEYQLMIRDQLGLEAPRAIALPNPSFYFRPAWSPDGKYIAYTDKDYQLWYVDIASGIAKKADVDRYANPNRSLNPSWSPDSKWIAYSRQLDNQFKAIFLYSLESGQTTQITDGLADAIDPVWDAAGRYLYFLASTDFGTATGWLDMSSYDMTVTRGLYLVVLAKEGTSPLLPRSDEEEPKAEGDKKAGKEESDNTVKIDLAGISQRILAVDVPRRNYLGMVPGPKDYVFYMEDVPNQNGLTLHRYNFKEQKSDVYLTGMQSAITSADRKQLLYQANSTWGIVKAEGAAKVGDGRLTLNMRMKVTPQEEWAQIFREGWRYQRDFLYVDNVHGAPWNDVYKWYRPWIDHVRHRTDLNYVVDILGGEVAVGHSYTSGGDFPEVDRVPIGLLGADLEEVNGYYRIKKIYTGESWNPELQAPLAVPGVDVRVGDYLLAVNGVALRAPTNPYSLFEGTANRQVKLRVNSRPDEEGARLVTVVPIANEGGLRMRDWVEGNRRLVDSLSNGKLAYVYVPNTGQGGWTYFNRYYYAQQDKQGAVIDERNNGGGSAADYMIDVMNRKLMGYFNNRVEGHRPSTTPMAGIFGPKVMIINERAGSGGDLLPYMFHKAQIGPLVGTRTWGGLVGTWDTPRFIDGGRMVAPRGGFFDTDGKWAVEGEGIAPDIEVLQDPAQVAKGRDPQLERAVQEAIKLMPSQTLQRKPEPPAPIRWKRPGKQ